jgi:2-oxoglutarate ferredoxin oxidoreductase subunit beta
MKAMKDVIEKKGFGFIEIVSQCPESYGRKIGMSSATDFLRQFKERSIRIEKAQKMTEDELEGRIIIGKLCDRERPEYVTQLHEITREQSEALAQEVPW